MVGGTAAAAAQPFLNSAKKRKRKKEKAPPAFALPAQASARVAAAVLAGPNAKADAVQQIMVQLAAIVGQTPGCRSTAEAADRGGGGGGSSGGGGGSSGGGGGGSGSNTEQHNADRYLTIIATEKGWVGRRKRKRQKRRNEEKEGEDDDDNEGKGKDARPRTEERGVTEGGEGGGALGAGGAANGEHQGCVSGTINIPPPNPQNGATAAAGDGGGGGGGAEEARAILACNLRLAEHGIGEWKFVVLPSVSSDSASDSASDHPTAGGGGAVDMCYQFGTYLAHEMAALYARPT